MHRFAKQIAECVKREIESKGLDNISPAELVVFGQWIDIAKDLAQYDKDMRIIDAMDEENSDDFMERMGYDRYRYDNGRFAPKGRGHRMGYRPYLYKQDDEWMDDYLNYKGKDDKKNSRYGESYDRYDEYRRHYHDSKDAESKRMMDSSTKEYTDDVIRNLKEMWSDADPTLRQTMKADITKLVQQMQ